MLLASRAIQTAVAALPPAAASTAIVALIARRQPSRGRADLRDRSADLDSAWRSLELRPDSRREPR